MTYPDWYVRDFGAYRALAPNGENVQIHAALDEREAVTRVDLWNFYQDMWAYRLVMQYNPPWLMDVGSNPFLLGVLSQSRPVTTIDIRPLAVDLPGLTCLSGTITDLPFDDASVPMAMSLSVIEHIGLGRYGDSIDPYGSIAACQELERVLYPGGRLLISVPIGDPPATLFNQNRVLKRESVMAWLPGCKLAGEFTIRGGLDVWCAEFVKNA